MSLKPEPGLGENDDTSGIFYPSESEAEDESDNYEDLGSGFQVLRPLPRCEERKRTLRDLVQALDRPDGIDLSPVYQRDFVWNEERQIGLVDSLFQGYPVPGLLFNKRSIRQDALVCIDGKQRLTSVKRFTEGFIPCHDRHGKKWWFRRSDETSVSRRKYLSQAAQAEFWAKKLFCTEFVGMSDNQEHELFRRVQRGNPLTLGEIGQAQQGDWQDLARKFQRDFVRVVKLSNNRRGSGHDKIISSFVQILHGKPDDAEGNAEVQFRGTNDWVQRYFVTESSKHPCTTELKDRMKKTFDRFEELARKNKRAFQNDGLNTKATIAPVEIIAIAYIIDAYGEAKTNSELEKAIRVMRREVRRVHSDNVRRKQMVWTTLIDSARACLGGQVTGGTKRAAPDEMEGGDRHRSARQKYGL